MRRAWRPKEKQECAHFAICYTGFSMCVANCTHVGFPVVFHVASVVTSVVVASVVTSIVVIEEEIGEEQKEEGREMDRRGASAKIK